MNGLIREISTRSVPISRLVAPRPFLTSHLPRALFSSHHSSKRNNQHKKQPANPQEASEQDDDLSQKAYESDQTLFEDVDAMRSPLAAGSSGGVAGGVAESGAKQGKHRPLFDLKSRQTSEDSEYEEFGAPAAGRKSAKEEWNMQKEWKISDGTLSEFPRVDPRRPGEDGSEKEYGDIPSSNGVKFNELKTAWKEGMQDFKDGSKPWTLKSTWNEQMSASDTSSQKPAASPPLFTSETDEEVGKRVRKEDYKTHTSPRRPESEIVDGPSHGKKPANLFSKVTDTVKMVAQKVTGVAEKIPGVQKAEEFIGNKMHAAAETAEDAKHKAERLAQGMSAMKGMVTERVVYATHIGEDKAMDMASTAMDKTKEMASAAKEKGKEMFDKGKYVAHDAVDIGEEMFDKGKRMASSALHRGEEVMEKGKHMAEEAKDEAKDMASSAMKKGEKMMDKGKHMAEDVKDKAMDMARDGSKAAKTAMGASEMDDMKDAFAHMKETAKERYMDAGGKYAKQAMGMVAEKVSPSADQYGKSDLEMFAYQVDQNSQPKPAPKSAKQQVDEELWKRRNEIDALERELSGEEITDAEECPKCEHPQQKQTAAHDHHQPEAKPTAEPADASASAGKTHRHLEDIDKDASAALKRVKNLLKDEVNILNAAAVAKNVKASNSSPSSNGSDSVAAEKVRKNSESDGEEHKTSKLATKKKQIQSLRKVARLEMESTLERLKRETQEGAEKLGIAKKTASAAAKKLTQEEMDEIRTSMNEAIDLMEDYAPGTSSYFDRLLTATTAAAKKEASGIESISPPSIRRGVRSSLEAAESWQGDKSEMEHLKQGMAEHIELLESMMPGTMRKLETILRNASQPVKKSLDEARPLTEQEREALKSSFTEAATIFKDMAPGFMDMAKEKISEAKEKAVEMKDEVRDKSAEALHTAATYVKKEASKVQEKTRHYSTSTDTTFKKKVKEVVKDAVHKGKLVSEVAHEKVHKVETAADDFFKTVRDLSKPNKEPTAAEEKKENHEKAKNWKHYQTESQQDDFAAEYAGDTLVGTEQVETVKKPKNEGLHLKEHVLDWSS